MTSEDRLLDEGLFRRQPPAFRREGGRWPPALAVGLWVVAASVVWMVVILLCGFL